MNTTMYDKLLKLPLFQGLSKNDLTVILEKVKVEFRSYSPKEYIVKQNDPCTELIFLLSGTVRACASDANYKFSLSEEINEQTIIEPYSLFGMRPFFHASYKAETATNILVLKKRDILPLLCRYDIFNLNYINLLSNRAQTMQQKQWNTHIGNTLEKIVNFLSMRCMFQYGTKELTITMEDLAFLLNDTRINVSRALNRLQEIGYISLSRKVIRINDLKDLLLEIENAKEKIPKANKE